MMRKQDGLGTLQMGIAGIATGDSLWLGSATTALKLRALLGQPV